jgi:hypothetical protein
MSGFEPEFGAVHALLTQRFYGPDTRSADDDVFVPRDLVDIEGRTARAVIVADAPNVYVLPIQFSPYLQISDTDEHGLLVGSVTVQNMDGKAALKLQSGTHRLELDRDISPLATATFAIGCLGLAVVVLARKL